MGFKGRKIREDSPLKINQVVSQNFPVFSSRIISSLMALSLPQLPRPPSNCIFKEYGSMTCPAFGSLYYAHNSHVSGVGIHFHLDECDHETWLG